MKKALLILTFAIISLPVLSQGTDFAETEKSVTILVHGWNPDDSQPGWMNAMRDSLISRTGGEGQSGTITVTGSAGSLTATCDPWTFNSSINGDIVILVNWTAVANHLNTGVTAQEVAAAVAPKIYQSQNSQRPLSELPIHLIGHSRGGGMVYELARLLGRQGVEVDQVTALDPHPLTSADPQPLTGDVIDTPIDVYENVLFSDVYRQNIEYPTGEYVSGAYNRLWESLSGGYHDETGYTYNIGLETYNFSDHLNTILMYHGTIDLKTPTENGEATLEQTERDNWFNDYENEGANTGFYYSRNIWGDRESNDVPVSGGDAVKDGYHNDALLGGNGARATLDWTNAVWPNLLTVEIKRDGTALEKGFQEVNVDEDLDISYTYRSYSQSSTINFIVDDDRNPYNNGKGTAVTVIANASHTATGSTITQSSLAWTPSQSQSSGSFYILAKINTGTHARYMYLPYKIDVVYTDLGISNIQKPVKNFTNGMPVTVTVENYGENTQSNFELSYTFGGNTVTETFTETLESSSSVEYTFSQGIDLSTEGIYSISAKTEFADNMAANDEYATEINNYENPNTMFFIYDDIVSIPDNEAFNFTGDFTIEAWFYAHSTKADGTVISKHANPGSRTGYVIEYASGNIQAVIGQGPDWATVSAAAASDTWHHVAMVYSGGTLEMFLNGVSQGTTAASPVMNNYDLYIGASQYYGSNWTGYIEEVRIWNDARTSTEIQDNIQTEIDPASENLLAYYTFNRGIPEGNNTAIDYLPDMTSNNYHGALNNFALQEGLKDGNFFTTCNLDLAAPEPDIENLPNITGECSVTVTETPTATDNCAGSITGTTEDALTYSEQGSYTIIWEYDDGSGHISSQTQTVIVEDVTDPVPDTDPLSDVTAECEVTALTAPTATDNCSGSISGVHDATLPITSSTLVTWTYEDENGNTSTQTQNVVINDNTDPVLSCPGDQTKEVASGESYYTVSGTEFDLTESSDNCGIASTSNDFNDAASLSGAQLPIGTTTITWTVTDKSGNTATCSFDITVSNATGKNDVDADGIKIYPVPANAGIHIESTRTTIEKLEIYDVTGKLLLKKKINANYAKIDISSLEKGMYLMNITNQNGRITKKLLKQ